MLAWKNVTEAINALVGPTAPYRGLIMAAFTLVAIWLFYWLSKRALRAHLRRRAHKEENILNFMLFWRYLWLGVGVVFVVVSLSGSFATLGISAAFLGMILGWSLQAPVTGIAAWLMIILKRPFKIGDRIIIAGVIGDVTDINLTHIVLNQVGGTIGGEEKSGRGVLIPNATLFQQVIYNYTMETRFILDEVPVLITYESDFTRAGEILLAAARAVTADIIAETSVEPFLRSELGESGVRIRLRYQALAMERQRITSEIVAILIREFNKDPSVEFCYPHTEVIHRPKPPAPAPSAGGQAPPTA